MHLDLYEHKLEVLFYEDNYLFNFEQRKSSNYWRETENFPALSGKYSTLHQDISATSVVY